MDDNDNYGEFETVKANKTDFTELIKIPNDNEFKTWLKEHFKEVMKFYDDEYNAEFNKFIDYQIRSVSFDTISLLYSPEEVRAFVKSYIDNNL